MMGEMFPLWLLRNLPNMVACHVAIAHDARGPNNTLGQSDVSSLSAIIEAVRVIQRDAADVMIAGGVGARIQSHCPCRYRGDMTFRIATMIRPMPADRSMPAAMVWCMAKAPLHSFWKAGNTQKSVACQFWPASSATPAP